MFVSFFPKPKLFLLSAAAWSLVLILVWFLFFRDLGPQLGFPNPAADAAPVLTPMRFFQPQFLWFFGYFFLGIGLFYAFWRIYSPHPWQNWSILGSGLIIFITNLIVQLYVALNDWRGFFFDMVQRALSAPNAVPAADLYSGVMIFFWLAVTYMAIAVFNIFFAKHWVFRWRTAMNEYFTAYWPQLRHLEGASQRVQDDTMRFSRTMETLGVNFIDAVMTLIAFLPLLASLSSHITELPFIGAIPYPLVIAALAWSIFGTTLLAIVGIKLPGLEFKNQRVEAAYRKELVYGEDDPARAQPPTLRQLFTNVRRNYFTLYGHYVYFDAVRYMYLQIDNVFALFILVPTLAAGRITFGIYQQIATAFGQVSQSFQYLVNSWPTIVELISIYKRLRAFEATLHGAPLPKIDQHYMERQEAGVSPEDQPAS